MKKSLIFWFAAITCAALFLVGCESPTNGDAGAAGAPGTIYLSGSQTTAGIQDAIDSGAPLVFAGVTQSDNGTVTIPAGRGVKLVGTAAYTTAASSILIVEATSSVTGTGTLVANNSSGTVIAPEGVNATTSGGSVIRIQEGDETIVPAAVFAVRGPITISGAATSATNIKSDGLSTHKLYVIGDVEVSAAITTAPTITVLGNVTVKTADQTQAVVWDIKGDLDAQKLPTTTTGTLKVGGNAVFTEGVTTITGTIDIGGNATFKAALTTSTGAVTVGGNLGVTGAVSLGGDLTVTGTATIGGTLTNTAAAVATFNGTTTVTNTVTTGTGGLTIGGEGAVTLTAAPTITNGLTVTNTTGVTMPSVTGITSQSITASSDGKVIFGNATGSVAITNGTLASGTGSAGAAANGAVTLTNGATLTLADTGTIVVAGTGSVVLPNSIFGAGTYTVTGTVTISSLTAGDTIVTGATDNTDKLAVGVLLLGEVTSAGTNAATYTLVKSNAGDKVSLDAANGKITLPADTGTTKGASLTVTAYAGITLGATGSIELGRKVSGAGAGKLALVAGATIGVFADTTAGNFNITSAANVADADDEATEKVAFGSANSSGTITAALKDVYGANGTAGYAVINTDTTLSS